MPLASFFILLCLLATPLSADILTGDSADADIRSDGNVSAASGGLIVGGAGSPAMDRCAVFVFQLPDLGLDPAPFENASLKLNLSAYTSVPPANIDLYGLGKRSTPTVLSSDYYGETGALDPSDAVLLQDTLLTSAAPLGPIFTSTAGSGQLRNYLNNAYDSGNGIGDYVFLRLSTDAPPGGVKRYSFTSADSTSADLRPQIIYNEVTAPSLRPFIWVRDSEKADILAKISNQPWAASQFNSLVARAASGVASHQADRDAFLRELPINWNASPPKFNYDSGGSVRFGLGNKLNLGLDCAVLFYLTGDTKYARCAGDILHNSVKVLAATPLVNTHQYSGWLFDQDLLMEARTTAQQMPVIYDFLEPYLRLNQVYEVAAAGQRNFAFTQSQNVFKKYTELCRDRGLSDNNWSSLMAHCLVQNALGIDDPTARASALNIYLVTGGPMQDSLAHDYGYFPNRLSVAPESFQYSGAIVGLNTALMGMLDRYDPSLGLFGKYPNLPWCVTRIAQFRYPNLDELIVHGDGNRPGGESYSAYEEIYRVAKDQNRTSLASKYGKLINAGIAAGKYNRADLPAHSLLGPKTSALQLLWGVPTVTESAAPLEMPRTDTLPVFGIAVQRNLPPNGDPVHGLMGFVGGAAHVHSHACGMNMELYGLGEVLGAKAPGKDSYSRTFAGANTVIVNGYSRGSGGWGNYGINTVQLQSMEPAASANAVSPNISFSTSTFRDDKGSGAQADQQRTLALIRTSPTSGYYVDLFRSDSSLGSEYHDYLYQNIGDSVTLESNGTALSLTSAPNRFQNDNDANGSPGWGAFTNTMVSGTLSSSVRARFTTTPSGRPTLYMDVHLPGDSQRVYATAKAPANDQAPSPYHTRTVPVLVVRKTGAAWNSPFTAVFEPHLAPATGGTVQEVTKLVRSSVVVGLKVRSLVDGEMIDQYVISNPAAGETYTDASIGLSFTGRFAVVTARADGSGELYLGEGSQLSFGTIGMRSQSGGDTQVSLIFAPGQAPAVTTNAPLIIEAPLENPLYLQARKASGVEENDQTIWFDAPTGGTRMDALNTGFSGNRFHLNGNEYESKNSASTTQTQTFGGTLVMDSGSFIEAWTNLWIVRGLDTLANSNTTPEIRLRRDATSLSVDQMTLSGPLKIRGNSIERDLTLNVATLQGSGTLSFGRDSDEEDSDWRLDIDNTHFSGIIELRFGNLEIIDTLLLPNATLEMQATTSSEDLINSNGNSLVLANNVTVKAMTYGGTSLPSGSYTAPQLKAFFGTSGRFSGAAQLTVLTATPDQLYATWLAQYPGLGGATGYNDDPDQDGASNLLEYALGGNPGVPDASSLTPLTYVTEAAGDSFFYFTYQRRTDATARGLTYTVRSGPNLSTPRTTVVPTYEVAPPIDGFELVTCRQAITGDIGFFELHVEITP